MVTEPGPTELQTRCHMLFEEEGLVYEDSTRNRETDVEDEDRPLATF